MPPSKKPFPIDTALERLKGEYPKWKKPIVTEISESGRDPYHVLVSTLISLRTKDDVTSEATHRLLALAATPRDMMKLAATKIEKAIYPAGFYKTKAQTIIDVSRRLVEEYGGVVPADLDTLLGFKGVGRKTANLVLTLGFGIDAICVDTHVHRISNRFGYVATATPEETEFALRRKLPKQYWITINDLLVAFGQNHCAPVSPRCSTCVLADICPKCGVTKWR